MPWNRASADRSALHEVVFACNKTMLASPQVPFLGPLVEGQMSPDPRVLTGFRRRESHV